MSGELSGHTGVVALAAVVGVSVLAVTQGGAVLLHATGGSNVLSTGEGLEFELNFCLVCPLKAENILIRISQYAYIIVKKKKKKNF